jgi:acetyl esterase
MKMTKRDQEILREWQEFMLHLPSSLEEMRSAYARWSDSHNHHFPATVSYETGIELRGDLKADVAVQAGRGPFPVIVYVHGGGWVMGSSSTHRKLAMQLAELGFLVLNLDYRLAPEHSFPAGLDDCVFAARWVGENAQRWKGDPARLAMAGDSAGANLGAAAMLALQAEDKEPRCRAGVLIYGLFDLEAAIERSKATGAVEGVARAYLGSKYPAALRDFGVSPLRGVGPGTLPPCLLLVGGADDLLPESQSMAKALAKVRIEHKLRIFEGMPHAFMQMGELSACRTGLDEIASFLRQHV